MAAISQAINLLYGSECGIKECPKIPKRVVGPTIAKIIQAKPVLDCHLIIRVPIVVMPTHWMIINAIIDSRHGSKTVI